MKRIAFRFFMVICSIWAISSCKKDKEQIPPVIQLVSVLGNTDDGDTAAIGQALRFKIKAEGIDVNLTNFTIKIFDGENTKTLVDSGLNSSSFVTEEIFYQGVEDEAEWIFTVMDRNRHKSSFSLKIYKDPNSQFGGIYEFPNVVLGYQNNTEVGQFFLPFMNKVYFSDSAALFKTYVHNIVYFNYREDGGVELPSPTFSSPGEDAGLYGEMYIDYYTSLTSWDTLNYTKYDIRADNGVSAEDFENAHNDSLLIVSYDNVWGKKKYKWATDGLIIPFQTANGKNGIIKVIKADTTDSGTIRFSMKIQR
ncbi:MAG: hypothetical protein JXR58_09440 [Bacteroidales bacterium]|nr:hypothetical protein [Bacteroidales bacterium]